MYTCNIRLYRTKEKIDTFQITFYSTKSPLFYPIICFLTDYRFFTDFYQLKTTDILLPENEFVKFKIYIFFTSSCLALAKLK